MRKTEYCFICGAIGNNEEHHIVFRSAAKFMINCKLNKIKLCPSHHRGTDGIHGRNGHKLDKKLKLFLQNNLEILFDKKEFTKEEIKEILDINSNSVDSLCKLLKCDKDKYIREDIIRACMGGKMIIE